MATTGSISAATLGAGSLSTLASTTTGAGTSASATMTGVSSTATGSSSAEATDAGSSSVMSSEGSTETVSVSAGAMRTSSSTTGSTSAGSSGDASMLMIGSGASTASTSTARDRGLCDDVGFDIRQEIRRRIAVDEFGRVDRFARNINEEVETSSSMTGSISAGVSTDESWLTLISVSAADGLSSMTETVAVVLGDGSSFRDDGRRLHPQRSAPRRDCRCAAAAEAG